MTGDARKAQAAERRVLEKRVHALEQRILALECRQKAVTAELEKPESYAAGGNAMTLNRELMTIADDLEKANAEWEAAAAKIE